MCFKPLGCLAIPLAQGIAGANGNSVLNGTGVPSNSLGVNGDFYIDTAANEIYGPKTAGAWASGINLVGSDGLSLLNGSGIPGSGVGVDGDFYIDTTADAIYGPKTSGAWGGATSLIGPTGPNGVSVIKVLGGGTNFTALGVQNLPPGGTITTTANQLCANNNDIAKIVFIGRLFLTSTSAAGRSVNFSLNINGVDCATLFRPSLSALSPSLVASSVLGIVYEIRISLYVKRLTQTTFQLFCEVINAGGGFNEINNYTPVSTGLAIDFAASNTIQFTGELTAVGQNVSQVQSWIERYYSA
jgi:hypothetical protein